MHRSLEEVIQSQADGADDFENILIKLRCGHVSKSEILNALTLSRADVALYSFLSFPLADLHGRNTRRRRRTRIILRHG